MSLKVRGKKARVSKMRRFCAAGFEDGSRDIPAKGCRVLEAGKVKEMGSSFEPPERYMVLNLP